MGICRELEVVGLSSNSWERAATAAVEHAMDTFADLCLVRRAGAANSPEPIYTTEVMKLDMVLEHGKVHHFRAVVKVSFTYAASSFPQLTAAVR
jgi:flavin-binding protein dodecin